MIGWILIILIVILVIFSYRAVRVIQRQMAMIKLQELQISILKEILKDYKSFSKDVEKFLNEVHPKLEKIIDNSSEFQQEFKYISSKNQELEKKLIEKETLINAYLMQKKK